MARLPHNIPVELHSEILKHAFHYSRRPKKYSVEIPPAMEWIDSDGPRAPRTPSSFPFNAALTCTLWRDILARVSECWTRVVFDVAADSTPLLDAFRWSKALSKIEVLVFNSAKDPAAADRDRERRRVVAIVDRLKPHIHRCLSIVFDVMYESSLPSSLIFFSQPAPNLYELALEFRVGEPEIMGEDYGYDLSAFRLPDPNLATTFPQLHHISIDGAGFMELCLFDGAEEWLEKLETYSHLRLRVARFEFPDDDFLMEEFIICLSNLRSLKELSLKDLSLDYGAYRIPESLYTFNLTDLHFENVSKDFLSELFACGTWYGERTTYTRCAIPRMFHHFHCFELKLDSIIADEQINGDGIPENSFHRILVGWGGYGLTVRSCPSFDDDLLRWLGREVDYTPYNMLSATSFDNDAIVYHSPNREKPLKTFPAENIQELTLHHCNNYSLEKLRWLIDVRKAAAIQEEIDDPDLDYERGEPSKGEITRLSLRGQHPKFTEEDLRWFHTGSISPNYRSHSELKFLGDDGHVLDDINMSVWFKSGLDFV